MTALSLPAGRNGVTLTAAGNHFHRYAVAAVRAWEQARQEIALPEGFRASFGLGAQVSLWERLVIGWIAWMRDQAADVALRLEADYSRSQMRSLADGLLDIGVMYEPRTAPGLVIEKLLEERLVLASSDARAVNPGWVDDYVFVDWGYDYRTQHAQAFPEMRATSVSVGLGALGLQIILAHGGSGYFPLRSLRPHLDAGRLHLVEGAPTFTRPAYMVFSEAPNDPELLELAKRGLRQVSSETGPD